MEVDGGGVMAMSEVEQPTKLVTEQIDLLLRAQVRAALPAGCGSRAVSLGLVSAEQQGSGAPSVRHHGSHCCQTSRALHCSVAKRVRPANLQPVQPLHCSASLANPSLQPVNLCTFQTTLPPCAQVLHLPAFEGRTDGRSQRTIIGHVAPRHLVIVNGTAEVGQVLGSRVHLCRIDKVC